MVDDHKVNAYFKYEYLHVYACVSTPQTFILVFQIYKFA